MSFLYVTLVTEGALIIFFPDKKRQGALIGAGVLNGANTVLERLVLTLKVHNVDDHNFRCSYQSGPVSVS